jgi:molybdopterin-guanine dinucleotide biosynthesis protein A
MAGMNRKIRSRGRPVTVIVLAGGRGRRMNADKARLTVPGGTLLERVLGQLAPYFDEVLVSASPGQKVDVGTALERAGPKPKVVRDEAPGLGPLGGLQAGLKAARFDVCAVVACDIPDIEAKLLRQLVRAAARAEIAVPVTPDGEFEPLFAVYRRSVVAEIEKLLSCGERSLIPLFGRCRTATVPLGDAGRLRNLNTRRDYEEYLRFLAGQRDR